MLTCTCKPKMTDKKKIAQMIIENLAWLNDSFERKKHRMSRQTSYYIANEVKNMNELPKYMNELPKYIDDPTRDELLSKSSSIVRLAEEMDDDRYDASIK